MRLNNFLALEKHPWLKRSFIKLTKKELEICINFLNETKDISKDEFAIKTVRLFLDKEKPKNWKFIEELLIASK